MKRLAIFVEGQTERLFVTKLLTEIVGKKNIAIESQQGEFGGRKPRTFHVLKVSSEITNQKYYVLVYDCGNDEKVVSDITDRYKSLSDKGYEKIIGLRDLYPKKHSDINRLENGLEFALNQKIFDRNIPIAIILAVMEVEAWFLAETSHFKRIHPNLTVDAIKEVINFDLINDNVEDRLHPSQDLKKIYKSIGKKYKKRSEE